MFGSKGITMIELLVAIVILGIVGSLSTPIIAKTYENMQKDKIIEDALHIERAAENYCLRPMNACTIGEEIPMEKFVEYVDGYDETYTVTVKRLSERSFGIYYAREGEYSFPFNDDGLLVSKELSARTASKDLVNIPSNSVDIPEQDFGGGGSDESLLGFPEWSEGTYSVGDRIRYDNKIFEIRHAGGIWAPPMETNLEPYGGFQEVEIGNDFRSYNTYYKGDTINYQGATYEMLHEGGNGETPSESLAWQEQTMSFTPFNVYNKDDAVIYNGHTYVAMHDGATGVEPDTFSSIGVWQNISSDKWEEYNTYYKSDVVEYQGKSYEALSYTQNDNPTTSSKWKEVRQDDALVSWNRNTVYLAGDQVIHGNTTYEAQWWTKGDNPNTYSDQYEVWQPVN